jgi:hypothetical protein
MYRNYVGIPGDASSQFLFKCNPVCFVHGDIKAECIKRLETYSDSLERVARSSTSSATKTDYFSAIQDLRTTDNKAALSLDL